MKGTKARPVKKGAAVKRKPARAPKPPRKATGDDDALERRFDGKPALEKLLAKSGALGDVDDVVGAFREAVAKGVPPQPVILALWPDEPRFESVKDAEALFSNLLGLYKLIASGEPFDLGPKGALGKVKREKAPAPEPLGAEAPTAEWLDAAWRYLEDAPREREKLGHGFDNKQDALVSLIDASGLSDAGFAVARELCFEVFAMLEVGGRLVRAVDEADVPKKDVELPEALEAWIDDGLVEAEAADELPLPEAEQPAVRALVRRLVGALVANARR
ncbi:MAG: hypothetical protein SFW67_20910 [Myxococcaceae bacterium]|nr:hypothetical protein [Myxococcaceae bacterium]